MIQSSAKISKYVSLKEATRSDVAKKHGIDNTPDAQQFNRIRLWAENIFDPIREHFKVPIFIWSIFRSPEVNELVGGAQNSQHLCNYGCAGDIDAQIYEDNGLTNRDIFLWVKDNLDFDQLIWEFGTSNEPDWLHISYVSSGKNRREIMIAKRYYNEDGSSDVSYSKY